MKPWKIILAVVVLSLALQLFVSYRAQTLTAAPTVDTLPITIKLYNRAGTVIPSGLTIGVRVVDAAGAGLDNYPVAIEVCDVEKAEPCALWVSKVSGLTATIAAPIAATSEGGWVVGSAFNDQLFRIACGTAINVRYVDATTTALVVTCVKSATAVSIESIRASTETASADLWNWITGLGLVGVIGLIGWAWVTR